MKKIIPEQTRPLKILFTINLRLRPTTGCPRKTKQRRKIFFNFLGGVKFLNSFKIYKYFRFHFLNFIYHDKTCKQCGP